MFPIFASLDARHLFFVQNLCLTSWPYIWVHLYQMKLPPSKLYDQSISRRFPRQQYTTHPILENRQGLSLHVSGFYVFTCHANNEAEVAGNNARELNLSGS